MKDSSHRCSVAEAERSDFETVIMDQIVNAGLIAARNDDESSVLMGSTSVRLEATEDESFTDEPN